MMKRMILLTFQILKIWDVTLLGWRISRLGFVTPIVGEVSLGPLGNAHHLRLVSIATNELVAV